MAKKLKRLMIDRVDLVDRGANQEAHIVLAKGDVPLGDALGKLDTATAALLESVQSIVADDALTEKRTAIEETFGQFADHAASEIGKSFVAAMDAASDVAKGEIMSDDVKKQLETLQKSHEDLKKKTEEQAASLAKQAAELDFHKMADAHKDYVGKAKLEGDALKGFVAKSAADRDAHIAANPIVEKKVELPEEIKKQLAEAEETKKRLAVLEEDKARATFAKKATDAGMPEAEGETIMKAARGDAAAVDKLVSVIKGLAEQVRTGKVFAEFGTSNGGDATSAVARIDATVADMRKSDPKLSRESAIAKIAEAPEHRELWQAYKAETTPRV